MAHMFSIGSSSGHVTPEVVRVAEAVDTRVSVVNYTDQGCSCGRGHYRSDCPRNRRHWFEGPNLGEPFNSGLAQEVEHALAQAGLLGEDGGPITIDSEKEGT